MKLSKFGEKFTSRSGILELMDDLGKALQGSEKKYMLGGGNPAHLDEINSIWRRRMLEILENDDEYERMLANYDTPQGKQSFLDALAEMINQRFGWNVEAKNIAITNGSQSGFFYLFNLFSGEYADGSRKKILFPLVPEYIGYADQGLTSGDFISCQSTTQDLGNNTFKYHVDFDNLDIDNSVSALCVSRPTNPTGNVLTDEEVHRLSEQARQKDIPFFIDNAYGMPFPNIIFNDVKPYWDDHVVLSMSLSKLGLPSVRTGIIVADEKIINAVSSSNAIMSLSSGTVGQVLTLPLIQSGEIIRISQEIIQPFYQNRAERASREIREIFNTVDGLDYRVHACEGSLFLWAWFRNLTITTKELYERLKKRHVIVVPGEYFFFGLSGEWEHKHQCIRINYSRDPEEVRRGLEIIAEELAKVL